MRILITGAGQGLGSCLAVTAIQRGHTVYAAVHHADNISKSLKQCGDTCEGRLHIIEMDVASDNSVEQMTGYLKQQGAVLDAVVNNAAIMIEREKTIEELELSAVQQSFEVNTIGPMRIIQRVLPYLYKGEKPVIMNVSSEAGTIINAFPTNYPYSMSKTALNMFSERLREHLKGRDILVYAVHPGWMRTNMGGVDAPADPADIAAGMLDIIERKKQIYSKICFIDSTGRPMPL